jgi:hypothetical protein
MVLRKADEWLTPQTRVTGTAGGGLSAGGCHGAQICCEVHNGVDLFLVEVVDDARVPHVGEENVANTGSMD